MTIDFLKNKVQSRRNILEMQKGKKAPQGTVRTWSDGNTYKKTGQGWKRVVRREPLKGKAGAFKDISVRNLNKGIDFKANERFLNDEIKGAFTLDEVVTLDDIERVASDDDLSFLREERGKSTLHRNQKEINKIFDKYKKEAYEKVHRKEYESFAQNLTPVHSLSIDKFMKVLRGGGLKALSELEESGKQSGYAIIESEIRPKFGDEVAKIMYERTNILQEAKTYENSKKLLAAVSEKHQDEFGKILEKYDEEVRREITKQTQGAVGYSVDKEIGTNKHVFSIMGPNGNGSGYGEISIVMKQDIMKHLDFNMTPTAGTSFVSGEMYRHREWSVKVSELVRVGDVFENYGQEHVVTRITDDKVYYDFKEEGKVLKDYDDSGASMALEDYVEDYGNQMEEVELNKFDHFHKSKLNTKENPSYIEYMAKDIAAQGSIDDYLDRESHGKWEAHLPSTVPLNMFQEVIMTEEVYKTLIKSSRKEEEQVSINKLLNVWQKELSKDNYKKARIIQKKIKGIEDIAVSRLNKMFHIKRVNDHDDILPYMNKNFKSGEWKSK